MVKERPKKDYENIYALPTAELMSPDFLLYQGITNMSWSDWEDSTITIQPVHRQRYRLEEDPQYQQIIPYLLLFDADSEKLFAYRRGVSGGDDRLHEMHSVGVGGHMNTKDVGDPIKAAHREFKEEVKVKGKRISLKKFKDRLSFIGLLKDWSNEVSSVHLGLLFAVNVTGWELESRNKKDMDTYWIPFDEVERTYAEKREECERWTQLVMEEWGSVVSSIRNEMT